MKTKYLNLAVIICVVLGTLLIPCPAKADTTKWPPTDFWNYPYDPSTFDSISFGLYDYPPAAWTCHWDFGDGSTYNECWVNAAKQYKADGDYTVNVQVTNEFGEAASASRVVSIRTHDVSITKFIVPQTASVGQTRLVIASLCNNRYPENVRVDVYKITPIGEVLVGSLSQLVPVRTANRTTAFTFNYTFTVEDARIGKVTFKAVAITVDVRDAWYADNAVTALPTRITK